MGISFLPFCWKHKRSFFQSSPSEPDGLLEATQQEHMKVRGSSMRLGILNSHSSPRQPPTVHPLQLKFSTYSWLQQLPLLVSCDSLDLPVCVFSFQGIGFPCDLNSLMELSRALDFQFVEFLFLVVRKGVTTSKCFICLSRSQLLIVVSSLL